MLCHNFSIFWFGRDINMKTKAFNFQVFLECLCYSAFAGLMFHLVASGKYLSYVTPRMKPYLYFTAIVMLIWVCAGIHRLFYPQYKVRSAHCFVLVIPILFLLLPHSPLTTIDISNKYIGGDVFSDISNIQPDLSQDEYTTDLPGSDMKNKIITVEDDYFYQWISEIFVNMEEYVGYQISITGFVFKDPEFMADNEFVPARLAMACCAADLTPFGMLCQYDKASELKSKSWVTVEGVIQIGKYMDYDDPQIIVTRILPAKEVEGYVYPY